MQFSATGAKLIWSQSDMQSRWGWQRQQVRTFIDKLQHAKMIRVKSNQHGSIITLCSDYTIKVIHKNTNQVKPQAKAYTENFIELWVMYPKRAGGNPKHSAGRAYQASIKRGNKHEDILAGLIRYVKFCEGTERIGTEYIMQGGTFFGLRDAWSEEWELPKVAVKKQLPKDDEMLWDWAKENGLSNPGHMENYQSYRARLISEMEKSR